MVPIKLHDIDSRVASRKRRFHPQEPSPHGETFKRRDSPEGNKRFFHRFAKIGRAPVPCPVPTTPPYGSRFSGGDPLPIAYREPNASKCRREESLREDP